MRNTCDLQKATRNDYSTLKFVRTFCHGITFTNAHLLIGVRHMCVAWRGSTFSSFACGRHVRKPTPATPHKYQNYQWHLTPNTCVRSAVILVGFCTLINGCSRMTPFFHALLIRCKENRSKFETKNSNQINWCRLCLYQIKENIFFIEAALSTFCLIYFLSPQHLRSNEKKSAAPFSTRRKFCSTFLFNHFVVELKFPLFCGNWLQTNRKSVSHQCIETKLLKQSSLLINSALGNTDTSTAHSMSRPYLQTSRVCHCLVAFNQNTTRNTADSVQKSRPFYLYSLRIILFSHLESHLIDEMKYASVRDCLFFFFSLLLPLSLALQYKWLRQFIRRETYSS